MKNKLVLVEWVDSHSGRGWLSLEEIRAASVPLYCRSVGWLIVENDKCVVIAPHISGERNGNTELRYSGEITIPRKAIIKTLVLREK